MSIKFDHTQSSINLALGIDDERSNELDALIFFKLIDQRVMAESLFDDPKDAPVNMRSKTGLLESVFESTKNECERIYVTFEYSKVEQNMDHNVKGIRGFMGGLHMLYQGADGDQDKFIHKFISYIAQAKKAHSEECGDDEDDY